MSKKVCHLLISYGNKNQNYTKELLDGFNELSTDRHFVFTHWKIEKSDHIKVIQSLKKPTSKSVNIFISLFFKDEEFRTLLKRVGKKETYKWLSLLDSNVDILHVHHAHAISLEVLRFFKNKGVKIIISLRGRDLLVNTLDKNKSRELKAKLQLANYIHTISEYMNTELYKRFDLEGKVIYRGQTFANTDKKVEKVIENSVCKVLVVGRLVWEKGHIFLLESIFRLKERGFDLQVDIYGDGKLYEMLKHRIKQLDLEKEINLKGFLNNDELKKKYKNYDVFVQSSMSEALSNALVDAMFCNLPCVITKVGGMPEIITHKKNGIVINPKNMWLLDQAILDARLLQIKDIKEFNDKINREKFSRKFEIDQLLKLYK